MAERRQWSKAVGGGFALTLAQILLVWVGSQPSPAPALCFSPDSKRLAATSDDWNVRIWDVETGAEPVVLRQRICEVVALAFTLDGRRLLTAGTDMNRMTWDADTGARLAEVGGSTGGVRLREFSRDAALLASSQRGVILENLGGGPNLIWKHAENVRAFAFSPDSRRFAIAARFAGGNPSVQVWNLEKKERESTLSCPDRGSLSLAFTSDSKRLGIAADEGVFIEGQEAIWSSHRLPSIIAFSPDGRILAMGQNSTVWLWPMENGRDQRILEADHGPLMTLVYSPEGDRLAAADSDGNVVVWDPRDGRKLHAWTTAGNPRACFYRRLYRWDVLWYASIAEVGYRTEFPPKRDRETSNVAFFPGQPILGAVLHRGLGLRAEAAVVLGSQLAAWGFWTYLLLFLQRFGATPWIAVPAVLAVLLHPAAFFLVNGYSEALFLMGLLGFLYWEEAPGPTAWLLAAGHGIVMTATRIVGLPLVGIPMVRFALDRWRGTSTSALRSLSQCGVASLGGLLFFAYCGWQFGRWDLYLETQKTGWGVHADYSAPLHWEMYLPQGLGTGESDDLSRLSVPLYIAFFCLLFLRERQAYHDRPDSGWYERIGFYLSAGIMFYISVCGLYRKDMASMIRYSFAIHVMLVLAGAHLATRWQEVTVRERRATLALLAVVGIACLFLQLRLIFSFTGGSWVA